jgi:hypothetical protein
MLCGPVSEVHDDDDDEQTGLRGTNARGWTGVLAVIRADSCSLPVPRPPPACLQAEGYVLVGECRVHCPSRGPSPAPPRKHPSVVVSHPSPPVYGCQPPLPPCVWLLAPPPHPVCMQGLSRARILCHCLPSSGPRALSWCAPVLVCPCPGVPLSWCAPVGPAGGRRRGQGAGPRVGPGPAPCSHTGGRKFQLYQLHFRRQI